MLQNASIITQVIELYRPTIVYCIIISKSCLEAGLITIPKCTNNQYYVIPSWKNYIQPLCEKSLFWHHIWIEAGRPGKGVLASIVSNTRAGIIVIKNIRVRENYMRKEMLAKLIVLNKNRDFGKKATK